MAFDGSEGELIPMFEAHAKTENFQNDNPNQPKGFFVGKDLVNELLNQDDCQGLRIYLGEKKDDYTVVIVGADSNEDDITDKIVDRLIECPPNCGKGNQLNNE